jgi:hypothetical protein
LEKATLYNWWINKCWRGRMTSCSCTLFCISAVPAELDLSCSQMQTSNCSSICPEMDMARPARLGRHAWLGCVWEDLMLTFPLNSGSYSDSDPDSDLDLAWHSKLDVLGLYAKHGTSGKWL